MTGLDALMVPPKSIWDPQSSSEDDENDDANNDGVDGSPSRKSLVSPRKHPSDLNEIELRVQLWDSYRLARIILGIPIKSFSLKSKTILHAIRIVAEMKLELIRLQKELELANLRSNSRLSLPSSGGTAAGPTTGSTGAAAASNTTSTGTNTEDGISIDAATTLSSTAEENHYKDVQKQHEEHAESTRSQLESIAERLQSGSLSAPSSGTSIDEQTQTEGIESLAHTERSEILDMVQTLMQKVEDKSAQLNGRFKELYEQMQSKQQDSANSMETLEKTLKTRQTIHSIELESNRAKHLQQVMDMTGQLESYKEQVEKQQDALMDLTAKCEELEAVAVTSEEAAEVLKAIESLENEDDEASPVAADMVQLQVVEILKKMSIMSSRNQREKQQLDELLKCAQQKERESEEEIAHLTLQMEMLKEENKIPPQEIVNNMARIRSTHKKHLTEILRREEKRLQQMEYMEVYLTELAFMSVEIEDLQKYTNETKAAYKEEVTAIKSKQVETHKTLKALKAQVAALTKDQRQAVASLDKRLDNLNEQEAENTNKNTNGVKNNSKGRNHQRSQQEREQPKLDPELQGLKDQVANLSRIRQLEEELAKRDKELTNVKNDLRNSQRRVEELESMGAVRIDHPHDGKYPNGGTGDSSICTSPLSSRSSS